MDGLADAGIGPKQPLSSPSPFCARLVTRLPIMAMAGAVRRKASCSSTFRPVRAVNTTEDCVFFLEIRQTFMDDAVTHKSLPEKYRLKSHLAVIRNKTHRRRKGKRTR